jgi:hypothetical protein
VDADDKEDTSKRCYRKQPPLVEWTHVMFNAAHTYCSLPGYLGRSRLNNVSLVSFFNL